ncbi:hypothetical protein F4824DRAFT_454527 [Ustulina deusta]|nr:hypothetical protein F4824DRAFT_454527 [Ustulina deusta]
MNMFLFIFVLSIIVAFQAWRRWGLSSILNPPNTTTPDHHQCYTHYFSAPSLAPSAASPSISHSLVDAQAKLQVSESQLQLLLRLLLSPLPTPPDSSAQHYPVQQ